LFQGNTPPSLNLGQAGSSLRAIFQDPGAFASATNALSFQRKNPKEALPGRCAIDSQYQKS
jgi:hypothetical protein